jgi:indole-3-glycerol phosphate synthase
MHNILQEIIENKKKEIGNKKESKISFEASSKPSVAGSLFKKNILDAKGIAIIAEIKLASPAHPDLGSEKEIFERAKAYERAGANAISFITEKNYFKGDVKFVPELKKTVSLPILQKDFVIDESQIHEAKEIGSDALLLIVRYLDQEALQKFVDLCLRLGIEPVVEINDDADLEKAVATNTNSIAVNARNLEDFTLDVDKACRLLKKIPDRFIKLGFSGIHSAKEVQQYQDAGARAVLVGTELMKAGNVKEFLTSLRK